MDKSAVWSDAYRTNEEEWNGEMENLDLEQVGQVSGVMSFEKAFRRMHVCL